MLLPVTTHPLVPVLSGPVSTSSPVCFLCLPFFQNYFVILIDTDYGRCYSFVTEDVIKNHLRE